MKEDFIKAYIWMYGGTKRKAMEVYRTAEESYIDNIIDAFMSNAKKSFCND